MYQLEYTGKFKREYKLALKRGYKEALIKKCDYANCQQNTITRQVQSS